MDGERYLIETVYRVRDETSALGSISDRLDGIAGQLGSVRSTLGAFGWGLLAYGATRAFSAITSGIVGLNRQLEDTSLAIGGTLQAFGMFGAGETAQAQDQAAEIMSQIRRDAAALPGEAQDFIEVFRTGLPAVMEAGERNLTRVANLTNHFAAAMISNQIDSGQAARDMSLILRGQAGMQARSWVVLLPHVRAVSAEMHRQVDSAEQWNRLQSSERLEILRRTLRRFDPMMQAAGSTWSAQSSTLTSNLRELQRVGTEPLFRSALSVLTEMNTWFAANERSLQAMANTVGSSLRDGFEFLVGRARSLLTTFQAIGRSEFMQGLVERGRSAFQYLVANGDQAARTGALGYAGFGGAVGMAGAQYMANYRQPALDDAAASIGRGFEGWERAIPALSRNIEDAGVGLGTFVASALPGTAEGFGNLMGSLRDSAGTLSDSWTQMMASLQPTLDALGQSFGSLANDVLTELGAAARGAAESLGYIMRQAGDWIDTARGWWDRADSWYREHIGAPIVEPGLRNVARIFGVDQGLGDIQAEAARRNQVARNEDQDREDADAFYRQQARDNLRARDQRMDDALNRSGNGDMWRSLRDANRETARHLREQRQQRQQQQQRHGHGSRVTVNQYNTINTSDDADRVFIPMRRALEAALHAPVESPRVRIVRGG